MMNARILLASLALGAMMLSACGGGGSASGGSSVLPAQPGTPTTTNPNPNANAVPYGANIVAHSQYVGAAHFAAMGLDVAMNLQNAQGLKSYAAEVSDPRSGVFHQFLTPQQIGQRFGASASDYAKTAAYLQSYGLHVGGWPQRLSLYVSGTQAGLEAAFGTKFGMYQMGSKKFIAPMSAPHFSIAMPIHAITNIVKADVNTRDYVPRIGDGVAFGYSPQQLRKVFDYQSAYNAGYNGAGTIVAIIGTGPISLSDVPAYGTLFNANVATVTQVNAQDQNVATLLGNLPSPAPTPGLSTSGLTTPPAVTGPCSFTGDYTTCNAEDGEAQLDTEQVAGLAPGAAVHFYLAYNPGECYQNEPGTPLGGTCTVGAYPSYQAEGINIADDEIQQIIADNTADVVSGSYGGGEQEYGECCEYDNTTQWGIGPAEFAALAAEGIASFFSTGDSGAEGCLRYGAPGPLTNGLCVGYPSTDPNVTAVGGVTTPMDAQGNLTNALTGWGVATSGGGPQYGNFGFGGSGGGCSVDFSQPSYQSFASVATQTPCSMRANPDVSLEADLATGVTVVTNAGAGMGGTQTTFYGGTSVAAPEMAAMWSLVVEACRKNAACAASTSSGGHPGRLGPANPYLYAIYANKAMGSFDPHLPNNQVFYDVLYGFNGMTPVNPTPNPLPTYDPGFNAGPGYDLITGIGVPYARHLIQAVVGV